MTLPCWLYAFWSLHLHWLELQSAEKILFRLPESDLHPPPTQCALASACSVHGREIGCKDIRASERGTCSVWMVQAPHLAVASQQLCRYLSEAESSYIEKELLHITFLCLLFEKDVTDTVHDQHLSILCYCALLRSHGTRDEFCLLWRADT